MSAESEARFEKLLLRDNVKFVETHRLEPSPIMFSELLEGRPSPTREGAFQQFNRRQRARGGARSLAQQLETTCVDRVIGNLEHVARWASNDLGLRPKDPSQPREMALQNARRVCWRVTTPQLFTQAVYRDN